MDKKLVALISKTQLKNMKAAGFKLIGVVDSGDYTFSTTKTAKFAQWEFKSGSGTDHEFNIVLEIETIVPTSRALIYHKIFQAGSVL